MATETKQQLKMDSDASTPVTQRREYTLLQNLGGHHHKLNLSKGMNFTLQCEVYMYSKASQGLHNFFQEMHIV
jgi:hypothetical protein